MIEPVNENMNPHMCSSPTEVSSKILLTILKVMESGLSVMREFLMVGSGEFFIP